MRKHLNTAVLIGAIVVSLSTLIYRNYINPPTKVPEVGEVTSETLLQEVKKLGAKVVIVNFWATWCEPCKEEIPALLELGKNYAEKGVRILFVSLDEPEDKDDVLQFVNEYPGMINLRKSSPGAKILKTLFEPWMGVIPVTLYFSGSGELIEAVEGVRNYQDFEKILQKHVEH